MVVALLFTACNQGEVIDTENSLESRGGKGEMIGFHKVVQIADGEFRPAAEGEFTFELWGNKKNGKGEPTFFGTFATDANGDVWVDFTKFKGQGRDRYYFREVFASEEEAAEWVPLEDLKYTMQASWGTQWEDYGDFDFNEGPTIVNVPVAEEIEEPVLGEPVGSVTLSNGAGEEATVWPETNHFCFATLTREQLVEGVKLEAVVGNPCNDTGDAFVRLVGDKIVFSIDAKGEVCVFAQTEEPAPVQGNPHSRRGHEDFDKEFSVDCPDGDVIYIYAHMDIQFYL